VTSSVRQAFFKIERLAHAAYMTLPVFDAHSAARSTTTSLSRHDTRESATFHPRSSAWSTSSDSMAISWPQPQKARRDWHRDRRLGTSIDG